MLSMPSQRAAHERTNGAFAILLIPNNRPAATRLLHASIQVNGLNHRAIAHGIVLGRTLKSTGILHRRKYC